VIVLPEETKERITGDLFEGLYRKRQIGFGKLFKTIKKELDLDDVEDGNLVQTGEDSQEVSRGQEIVAVWNWQRKNYFLQLLRNMLVSFIIRCI
jgi:plasmid rolling circle replication initiator protein Rep